MSEQQPETIFDEAQRTPTDAGKSLDTHAVTAPKLSLVSSNSDFVAVDDCPRAEKLRDAFDLLSPSDLGHLIGVDERTLASWRAQHRGPDHAKLGRAIFYRRSDVGDWIKFNVVPTDRAA